MARDAERWGAIASRSALRVCANISLFARDDLPPDAISVLRVILISAVRGSGRTAEVDWLESAALSANSAALSAASADSENVEITAFATAAWPDRSVPEAVLKNHEAFLAFMNSDRTT